MPEKGPYTNRLIHEKSPYLLQHAHNPVDWYPWGEEAFKKAKEENKPVFLSIGYASCHFCHVMGEESFNDPTIGSLLNDTFINIKVDREEMPYVDSLYMEMAQGLMPSSGGWPLNVILTSDLKPFFAVTYLPKEAALGLLSFAEVIQEIRSLWNSEERLKLIEQAEKVVDTFEKLIPIPSTTLPTTKNIENSTELLLEVLDPLSGGFKGAPKFPLSFQLLFLLFYAKKHTDSRFVFLVELTLDHMGRGGIYDQLGGGFSRYSVDGNWQVPHFEKMLYDNALLGLTYAQAYRLSQLTSYQVIAEEIFAYILREMVSEEGGFYSSEDADTNGCEGLFYTWTYQEIKAILPPPIFERISLYYGITAEGNFDGRTILHIENPIDCLAKELKIEESALRSSIEEGKKMLLLERKKRPKPVKDTKTLSSWSGLMIHSLVIASAILQKEEYLQAAVRAASFIQNKLVSEGRLLRRYCDNEAKFTAGLEEYAYMIQAVLSLFEAGLGSFYLRWALQMTEILEREFLCDNGAFYETDGKEMLLFRKCDLYDGATPSGNAVHTENLLRLYQITGNEAYRIRAEAVFKSVHTIIDLYPPGCCYHLLCLLRYYDDNQVVVWIALDEEKSLEKEIKKELSKSQLLHCTIVWRPRDDEELLKMIPHAKDRVPIDNKTTIYVEQKDKAQFIARDRETILTTLRGFYE